MIVVHFDQRRVDEFVGGFIKQVPFGVSVALNNTAFEAQRKLRQDTLPRTFTLRSQWTKRGIRVVKSNKRKLVAEIGSRDWYMADHEGGARRAPRGRRFAIPVDVRPNEKVRITPAKRPWRLMKVKFGRNRPFIAKMKSGKEGIFVRRYHTRLPLQLLYHLHRDPLKITDRTYMRPAVEEVVNRRMAVNFKRAMVRAIRTAK